MGLDIYSGTLTRYYCRNWKTKVQRIAEESDFDCTLIDECVNKIVPIENPEEISEVHKSVCQWIDSIAHGIDSRLTTPLWDERSDIEYYSDKPDWTAFGALVLVQACCLLKRRIPEYIVTPWSAYEDDIVNEAREKINDYFSLLDGVSFWLPIPEEGIYSTHLPNGKDVLISTVALLKKELTELNRQLWNADKKTILNWREEKFYTPVKENKIKTLFKSKLCHIYEDIQDKNGHVKYYTEELAQFAFSILYQAVDFAEEHRLPIVLDY